MTENPNIENKAVKIAADNSDDAPAGFKSTESEYEEEASPEPVHVEIQAKEAAQPEPPEANANIPDKPPEDTDEGKKAPRSGHKPHSEPVFILVLISYLLLLLSRVIDTYLVDRGNEYFTTVLLQIMIFLIPSLIYTRLRGSKVLNPSGLRLRIFRIDHIFILLSGTLILICGCLLLGIVCEGLNSSTGNFTLYNTFTSRYDDSATSIIYLILAYAALPAVCEEFLFRGILCRELEAKSGVVCASAVSATFFALLHFNIVQFPVYLFAGIVLCLVMYVTRSVIGVAVVHFLYNVFCIFVQSGFAGYFRTASSTGLFVMLLIIFFVLFTAIFCGEASRIYKTYARDNKPSDYAAVKVPLKKLPAVFIYTVYTPSALLSVALYAVVTLILLFT